MDLQRKVWVVLDIERLRWHRYRLDNWSGIGHYTRHSDGVVRSSYTAHSHQFITTYDGEYGTTGASMCNCTPLNMDDAVISSRKSPTRCGATVDNDDQRSGITKLDSTVIVVLLGSHRRGFVSCRASCSRQAFLRIKCFACDVDPLTEPEDA